jgi:signal peptidase II
LAFVVGDSDRHTEALKAFRVAFNQLKGHFMRTIPRILVVMATLIGCVGCDQVSKSAARALLPSGVTESLFADSLRLELVQNPGSFLSLGATLPAHLRFILFTTGAAAVLIALVCASLFARRLGAVRIIAIGLVAGGGLSNLIDRLAYDGFVTDFLNVGIGSFRTGIFNVADMTILAGALLLVLSRQAPRVPPPPKPQPHDLG